MNKCIKLILVFFIICIHKQIKADDSKIENLVKNGELVKIRGYYEAPSGLVFVNSDPLVSRPAKFIDFAKSIESVLGDWNVTEITKNLPSSLIFGKLIQMIKNDKVESESNFYRLLTHIDEYTYPTIAKFDMPLFMRERLDLPSILDCNVVKYRLIDVDMSFYLNFDTYSPFENKEAEQLICLVKGNLSMVLLRPEEYEKFVAIDENSKEEDLKSIKHSIGEIDKGQCFYIPSKSYYVVKADNAWFYSISWAPLNEGVNETECYSGNKSPPPVKVSNLAFKKDFNRENLETKLGFVSYFLLYLDQNESKGLNKNDFVEKVKNDQTIMKMLKVCDNQCPFILAKLFSDLDINEDLVFSLNDILNLDFEMALKLNKNIEKHIQDLGQSTLNQLENLKNSFKQLRDLADQHGMTDKVMDLLKEKLGDWKKTLTEEDKQKFGDVEIDKLFEKLFGFDESTNKRDERAKRREEAKKLNDEAKKNPEEKETSQTTQTFVNIEENEEAEILAEDDESNKKEEL